MCAFSFKIFSYLTGKVEQKKLAHLKDRHRLSIKKTRFLQYGIPKYLESGKTEIGRGGSMLSKKDNLILAKCLKRKIAIPPSSPRVGAHLWADEASLVSF